jgi:hypothetical protein
MNKENQYRAALIAFVEAIESVGGVTEHTDNLDGGPITNPEWLDLGDAYRDACKVLGQEPLIY